MHFSMLRKDNNPLCKFSTFNRAESIWGKSSLIAARDCTTIRNLYANGYCFCVPRLTNYHVIIYHHTHHEIRSHDFAANLSPLCAKDDDS